MTEDEKNYLVRLVTTATDTATLADIAERLRVMSHVEGISVIAAATLGAASGIISGLAKGLAKHLDRPAAAGQDLNVTSLDV